MVDLVLEHPRLEARGLDRDRLALDVEAADPRVQRPLDVDETRGRLRQPSSAIASSSESHSTSGLTSAVGSPSGPAWKTSSRRRTPSWVAARPTPSAVAHDRDHPLDLGAQLGAELGDLRGLLFSTGSPNLTTWAERRARGARAARLRARRSSASRSARSHRSSLIGRCLTSVMRAQWRLYCGSTSTPSATSLQRRGRRRGRSTASRTAATVAARARAP